MATIINSGFFSIAMKCGKNAAQAIMFALQNASIEDRHIVEAFKEETTKSPKSEATKNKAEQKALKKAKFLRVYAAKSAYVVKKNAKAVKNTGGKLMSPVLSLSKLEAMIASKEEIVRNFDTLVSKLDAVVRLGKSSSTLVQEVKKAAETIVSTVVELSCLKATEAAYKA